MFATIDSGARRSQNLTEPNWKLFRPTNALRCAPKLYDCCDALQATAYRRSLGCLQTIRKRVQMNGSALAPMGDHYAIILM